MKLKIPKGPPKKTRGEWKRKPVTQVKESKKIYKREGKKKWGLKEFVESVDEVMQNQEKENPALKQMHARLSPEWKSVSEKIARLLTLQDEKELERLREEIVAEGEMATRVLIDFLLTIKHQAGKTTSL